MNFRFLLGFLVLVALLSPGCTTTMVESFDSDDNYRWKFDLMPEPKATVVHSRVEREYITLLPPRNGKWEFELIVIPSWLNVLKRNFVEIEWSDVEYRTGIPKWFNPEEDAYTPWHLIGTSGVISAHLFVERMPHDPNEIRIFIRRY